MKKIALLLLVAMTSCVPYSYSSHTNTPQVEIKNDVDSSWSSSSNDGHITPKESSAYERCMERNRGSENASDNCEIYVEASMPCVDESCKETTTYHNYYGY